MIHQPITCEVGAGQQPLLRKQLLGKTALGQQVDGATYSIGWPYFTLMELNEDVQRRMLQRRQLLRQPQQRQGRRSRHRKVSPGIASFA